MKINIYASCGLWKPSMNNGWGFLVDEEKGGRLLTLDTSSSFENLKAMVCEDFGIDVSMVNIELSYLPSDLINSIYSPPVIITSDRQVRNFLTYVKNKTSMQLCVSTQASNIAEEGTESPNREEAPMESDDSSDMESDDAADMDSEEDVEVPEEAPMESTIQVIWSLTMQLIWIQKKMLRYLTVKMTKKGLTGSSYFIIKKYVPDHSCAASNRKGSVRTVSAKTVGILIMHKYETAKEGPRLNDIIQYMRMVHGVEISYSLAWDAREYAINAVKGIPEKGYEKIPKYLHMMKEANPGSHTFYERDTKGRFKFLFISFGQSVRSKSYCGGWDVFEEQI
uniref:MULE transposase N-terminal all-beta domain-containing protein n=1 Tax=Brassica oleracea var. oleracea TaxID=109376 RepID=A0A0D3CD01_BRAOL